jgi:hypothetical protein
MEIEIIHTEITELFKKYKIPALTVQIPMGKLHNWAQNTATRLNLDENIFRESIAELFWTTSQVQLALGYALLSRQSSNSPKGIKGIAYHPNELPRMMGLPEIHTRHHLYCCIECIYRCWERLSIILIKVCYPNLSDQESRIIYFDGIVKKLSNDKKYNNNPKLRDLQNQAIKWNKVAQLKNEVSHGASSPFRNIQIEGETAEVYGPKGEFIFKFPYSSPNLIEEIDEVKDKYLQLAPVIKAVNEFVNNISI